MRWSRNNNNNKMHRCLGCVVGGLGLPRLLFTHPLPRLATAAARGLRTPARSLRSTSAAGAAPSQDFSALLGLLRDKDAQLVVMLRDKDAQLAVMLHDKDGMLRDKDAQLAAVLASKDAQLVSKDAALQASQSALLAVSLAAARDATALATALHERDIANGKISVRSVLEVVIDELWAEYGNSSKVTGATERLRLLAKGACPQLAAYVAECAAANQLGEAKALAMLPNVYKNLSGPMHALSVLDEDAPIEAVLQGDATALLVVSCLFKFTRRNLRLYRVSNGLRQTVTLQLKEPPVKAIAPAQT